MVFWKEADGERAWNDGGRTNEFPRFTGQSISMGDSILSLAESATGCSPIHHINSVLLRTNHHSYYYRDPQKLKQESLRILLLKSCILSKYWKYWILKTRGTNQMWAVCSFTLLPVWQRIAHFYLLSLAHLFKIRRYLIVIVAKTTVEPRPSCSSQWVGNR